MKNLSRLMLPLVMLGVGLSGPLSTAIANSEVNAAAPELLPSETAVSEMDSEVPMIVQEDRYQRYQQVIERTKGMVWDPEVNALAESFGLHVLDVTWEDTGRFHNSAVGPNISDMTIQVQQQDPRSGNYDLHLMPVIRHPNFSDQTADVPIDRFFLLAGNERGEDLQRVSLKDFLANVPQYLSQPDSWAGDEQSLLAERDTHVLVSAQACFLPIPQGGIAEFNPVLFNYQSYPGDPALLSILATREGSSVTIIDNQRDAFEAGQTWGQRLFFNQNGERASLTGQRLSDFQATTEVEATDTNVVDPESTTATEAAGEEGLNMVMLIQVPLKQREPFGGGFMSLAEDQAMPAMSLESAAFSNVEEAVIGHGAVEGPFTEIDGLTIERDPDFPIRVTVQFYKGSSNGVVSKPDLAAIHQQINRVYEDADYVGSLVLDGNTGRPTEYEGPKEEPEDWWERFWRQYEERLGRSRESAEELWRRLRRSNSGS
ncbi:MAG: hypothetical protein MJA27_11280 [Pseudanabaenales cyanobacterium]|nr:hypothetical protein [Pseudanabaenales cyanobacterium]